MLSIVAVLRLLLWEMVKRVSARARLVSTTPNPGIATIVEIRTLLEMHRFRAAIQLKRTREFDDWE